MAFVPPTNGVYPLDPNEPPPEQWELDRADVLLHEWHKGRRPYGSPPVTSKCPHEDESCASHRECLGKIAWWRRYIRQIEGIA